MARSSGAPEAPPQLQPCLAHFGASGAASRLPAKGENFSGLGFAPAAEAGSGSDLSADRKSHASHLIPLEAGKEAAVDKHLDHLDSKS